ncbi:hypothetical protein DGMP_01650 [Desulfomarina profundi]|uniref:Uncharacterized protein n=1 Tax=Desulfomarina profundi TaxID=2772557 RepID=A0A8D5FDC5_9BACT|nr:hypothetical protein DGMP_01650 [Desulfomarina profundi]
MNGKEKTLQYTRAQVSHLSPNQMHKDRLYTRKEAADILRVKPNTLAVTSDNYNSF